MVRHFTQPRIRPWVQLGGTLLTQHICWEQERTAGTEQNRVVFQFKYRVLSKATEMKDKVLPCIGRNKEQGLFVLRNKNRSKIFGFISVSAFCYF